MEIFLYKAICFNIRGIYGPDRKPLSFIDILYWIIGGNRASHFFHRLLFVSLNRILFEDLLDKIFWGLGLFLRLQTLRIQILRLLLVFPWPILSLSLTVMLDDFSIYSNIRASNIGVILDVIASLIGFLIVGKQRRKLRIFQILFLFCEGEYLVVFIINEFFLYSSCSFFI